MNGKRFSKMKYLKTAGLLIIIIPGVVLVQIIFDYFEYYWSLLFSPLWIIIALLILIGTIFVYIWMGYYLLRFLYRTAKWLHFVFRIYFPRKGSFSDKEWGDKLIAGARRGIFESEIKIKVNLFQRGMKSFCTNIYRGLFRKTRQ